MWTIVKYFVNCFCKVRNWYYGITPKKAYLDPNDIDCFKEDEVSFIRPEPEEGKTGY